MFFFVIYFYFIWHVVVKLKLDWVSLAKYLVFYVIFWYCCLSFDCISIFDIEWQFVFDLWIEYPFVICCLFKNIKLPYLFWITLLPLKFFRSYYRLSFRFFRKVRWNKFLVLVWKMYYTFKSLYNYKIFSIFLCLSLNIYLTTII